ncbi:MAG: MOSC N-terminal beta barrel domain-containing protein [Gammaproteobacteria bacterium]|nr:MOSC N-terminal beta barrel domain-containing protein [Gammaproteobacteria bacterium]NND60512.1 MOSC domain-containing protein [Gammaproteobacteria bacterium]
MATLERLFVYPIKSTAPVELEQAQVTPLGLQHDRRYVITDADGRFLTARRFPSMVLIQSRIEGDGLVIEAPGCAATELDPETFPARYSDITIWKDTVSAQHCPAAVDTWFSDYLGIEAHCFYMGAASSRPARGGGEVSFADAAPLMLLSQASIDALNERLDQPVEVRNFRPNLLVSNTGAHAEDEWRRFTIGAAEFEFMWPCSRCVLTTVDPDTGSKRADRQPLATLFEYRKEGNDALFGINVRVKTGGSIASGQPVRLI